MGHVCNFSALKPPTQIILWVTVCCEGSSHPPCIRIRLRMWNNFNYLAKTINACMNISSDYFQVIKQDLNTIPVLFKINWLSFQKPSTSFWASSCQFPHKLCQASWIIYASVSWRPSAAFTVTHVGCPSGSVSDMQVCEDAPFLLPFPPPAVWCLICY